MADAIEDAEGRAEGGMAGHHRPNWGRRWKGFSCRVVCRMWSRLLLVFLCLQLFALSGCGGLFRVRDDYMGKALLQPDQIAQPVARDEHGEAILAPE